MHQSKLVLAVATVGPYVLLLDVREEAVDSEEKPGNSNIVTKIRLTGIPDVRAGVGVTCIIAR